MSGTSVGELSKADDLAYFVEELRKRRDRVYDYIDNWPGTADFRPEDVHDGLFSYVRHKGKGLRPSLLMLCAGAVGGDEEQAIPAAASVELFHIWTLVHDDIIDRDDLRRGSPTVHAQYAVQGGKKYGLDGQEAAHYGRAVAILSGDLQQGWSFGLLCDLIERGVDPQVILNLIRRMANSLTPQLLEGEMLDVQFALTPPDDVSQEQIRNMLTGKTSALLEYSAWAGATIGLGGREDPHDYANILGKFAGLSGLAFQLQDDILGLTADEAKLGKPVGSDLREGKHTLILHFALEAANPEQRATLMRILGKRDASRAETANVFEIMQDTGALRRTEELADSLIKQSLTGLEMLPESPSKDLLRSWSSFLLARSY